MRHRPSSWLRPLLALSLAGALGCAPVAISGPPPAAGEQPAQPEAVAAPSAAPAAPAPAVAPAGALTFEGQALLGGKPMAGAAIAVLDPVTRQPLPVGQAPEGKAHLVAAPAAADAEGRYSVHVAGLPAGRAVLLVASQGETSVSGVFLGPPPPAEGYHVQRLNMSLSAYIDEVTSLQAHLMDSILMTAHLLTPAAAEPVVRTALDKMTSYRVAMGATMIRTPELLHMVTRLDQVQDARRVGPRGVDLLANSELRQSVTQIVVNNLRQVAKLAQVQALRATSIEEIREFVTRVPYPGTDLVGHVDFETWTITLANPKTGRSVNVTENPDGAARVAPPSSSGGDDSRSAPAPTPTPVPTVTEAQLTGINSRVYETLEADKGLAPATWDGAATAAVDLTLGTVDGDRHLGVDYTADGLKRYFHFNASGQLYRATDLYDPATGHTLEKVTASSGPAAATGNVTVDGATKVLSISGKDIEAQTLYFDDAGLRAMIMPSETAGKVRVVRWTGATK